MSGKIYYDSVPHDFNDTEVLRSKASLRAHKRQQYLLYIVGIWAAITTILATYSLSRNSHSVEKYIYDGTLTDQQDGCFTLTNYEKRNALRKRKRNLIFMVSDGMGPASLSMTRSFRQFTQKLPINDVLSLDKNFIGVSRTLSSSSLVTDSAAGATAFSCGIKSYNGAIAVHPDTKAPCGTILEAAKKAGYTTGLVVTTKITDATPASFSAHVLTRSEQDLIAQQQLGDYPLGRVVDLMIGGGRCSFLPKSKGGCRADNIDLVQRSQSDGWTYFDDLNGFESLQGGQNVTLPLLGLLASEDIPYEIDRDSTQYPSLEETTKTALRALELATQENDQGFFIMIEGSRIDHAGHHNDPAAQVREVLAYDKAFQAAIDFANESDTETVIISTSDHETGGLSTAKQISPEYPNYLWIPEVLANVTHSGEYLAKSLKSFEGTGDALKTFIINKILIEGLGTLNYTHNNVEDLVKNKNNAIDSIVQIISNNAQIGWSTHGHSAVDVNIYGYAKNRNISEGVIKSSLVGNHENVEIGVFMESYLDVDLMTITNKLAKIPFKTST